MSPPPHDLTAEAVVLSAVLWGDRTAAELRLRASWFWAPDHQLLWLLLEAMERLGCEREEWGRWTCDGVERVGAGPDTVLIAAVLGKIGRPYEVTFRQLHRITGYAAASGTVEGFARRIRERHRERQAIAAMQRIDAALRAGERPSAELLRWTARRLEQMGVD